MIRRYFAWVFGAVIILTFLGVRYLQVHRAMGCTTPVSKRLVIANTGFAIRLFKDVAAGHSNRNIFVSPCGVSLALTLAYNGAMDNTRKAMASSLGLDGMNLPEINESSLALMSNLESPGMGVKLAVANAAWINKHAPIEPHFVDVAKRYYKAEVANLDFTSPSAASSINKWAFQKTQGRISNIADGLDDLTVLCLTNAVYFKGVWTHCFDKERTQNMPFILADGTTKNVAMMQQDNSFKYYHAGNFDAAALPYGGGRTSMYIFLPNRNSSLSAFLDTLSMKDWDIWMSRFQETKLRVSLPRWALECQTQLKDACSHLGMGIAFDPKNSNFRGLCKYNSRDNVYIGVLKQKAFVKVDEEGTEACAATINVFKARSGVPEFRVNRPFFYVIRDNQTGEILFMGSVADPALPENTL